MENEIHALDGAADILGTEDVPGPEVQSGQVGQDIGGLPFQIKDPDVRRGEASLQDQGVDESAPQMPGPAGDEDLRSGGKEGGRSPLRRRRYFLISQIGRIERPRDSFNT